MDGGSYSKDVAALARTIGRAKPPPFGYLLTLDCYFCRPVTLLNINAAYWLLVELSDCLGMTRKAPPFVFASPPEFPDKAGLSGWVPLIESGISIHTLWFNRFASLDIYCCRQVNRDIAVAIVKDCYAPNEIEINHVERGKKYHVDRV